MNTCSIIKFSFIDCAEKVTAKVYSQTSKVSILAAEILGRLAALLLSPAAALDICFHTLMIIPTFFCSLVKWDFTSPWQHLQRVRNAIAPLVLGTAMGILHPYAGIAVSEPTDKQAVTGMLSSNGRTRFTTPCSPIHSMSIVEDLAKDHPKDEQGNRIFSEEHVRVIGESKDFEKYLEMFQAQEFVFKITNVMMITMAAIVRAVENSSMDPIWKDVLIRVAGLIIPALLIIDLALEIFMQAFFLAAGAIRCISGRGPIYTESTTNPLMHISFFLQYILKIVGQVIAIPIWFISPRKGLEVGFSLSCQFFKAEKMSLLMLKVRYKLRSLQENERTMIPIAYNTDRYARVLSAPFKGMHKTYLLVEKKDNLFNLYWVNRPNIQRRANLSEETALNQIDAMLNERFPFMDKEKLMNYPIKSNVPELDNAERFGNLAAQGNYTNCVVSNLFASLEVLDRIQGVEEEISSARYKAAREILAKDYSFYENSFTPFNDSFSLDATWAEFPQLANRQI
jgi:hypothetical protein